MKSIKTLLVALALTLATAACDGPVGPAGEDGQDGADGQDGTRGPRGPAGEDGQDGEDGNANVTLYITAGHDFAESGTAQRLIFPAHNGEETIWLVYLDDGGWKHLMPGYGPSGSSEYRLQVGISSDPMFDARITKVSGPGESFSSILIFRIESGGVVNCPSTGLCPGGLRTNLGSLIPSDLDVSDFGAVMDYYGLTEADAVRL